MKTKYIGCIASIALVAGLCSCEQNLELYPPDKVSSHNYWKTKDDAERAVNATYGYVFPQSDGQGEDLFFLESCTDNSYNQHSNQFSNFQQIALGTYEADHGAIKIEWDRKYICIRRCSEFMSNIGKVPLDAATRNRFTSEVLFQRAYSYCYLTAFFGDVPWIDRAITIQEANSMKRMNKIEIADKIIADLDTAIKYLPSAYSAAADNGRATKWAAAALQSRICLIMAGDYRENPASKYWAKAASAARLVWKTSAHRLNYIAGNPLKSYSDVFTDNNLSAPTGEVIYGTQFTTRERPLPGFFRKLASCSDGGWNSWVPTQDMIDAYGMKSTGKYIDDANSGYDPANPFNNRDPRMTASCYYPGCMTLRMTVYTSQPGSGGDRMDQGNGTKTGYGWRKYLNMTGDVWDSGNDFPLLRLGEALLNFAEAQNEVSATPDQDTYDAINAIRRRVEMPDVPAGLTKYQMRDAIRRERRVELAFEGIRFFDIRRWKIAEEALNKNNGWILGMTLTNNPNNSYIVNAKGQVRANIRTFDKAKHYLWPIPRKEAELNPNLLPNNPGWTK